MPFDKAALFAALKPKTKTVQIEGAGEIEVGQLTLSAVESLRAKLEKEGKKDEFSLWLVVACVTDKKGKPIFDESDIAQLNESSAAMVEPIMKKALEVNGFLKAQDEKN
jgi:hypothetical protein